MKGFLFLVVFASSSIIWAQTDTIQKIEEVVVSTTRIKRSASTKNKLEETEIREANANDIGELIQTFSGTSLRSYGGLGGLKTISVRSLGASHLAIVKDGFLMTNSQTGQVNLGQIPTNNLTRVEDVSGEQANLLLPVSSMVIGSAVSMESFENTFSNKKLSIRSNVAYGSFNRMEGNVSIKYAPKKFFIALTGAARRAEGKYPYSLQNGLQAISGLRANNDYMDYSGGVSIGCKLNSFNKIRVGLRINQIDQGLPGAIIFYNQTQNERLTTSNQFGFVDYTHSKKSFHFRMFVNGRLNKIHYYDPDYLNDQGELDVLYHNKSLNGGVNLVYDMSKSLRLFGGVEEIVSGLTTNDTSFARPLRFHSIGLIGGEWNWKFKSIVQLSGQYIEEQNRNGSAANNHFKINPFVRFETYEGKMKVKHILWYRNSFRMPSFNELYYNNIGNLGLNPERTNQFNYSLTLTPCDKQIRIETRLGGFYNKVQDKIVALPTKNLFVWSMQNIGQTDIFGGEAAFTLTYFVNKHWKLKLDGNYTYQKVIDKTDPNSPTYNHQLAYTPEHISNVGFSVRYKKTHLNLSNYFNSYRYSLNENVDQNLVDGFVVTDISLQQSFRLKKGQLLQLQVQVKNTFNNSYAYIRSFVMPGRNFLISLKYALN